MKCLRMKRVPLIVIVFAVAILCVSFKMSAQTSIVDSTLAVMFENLDTSIISTGYLKDRAFERVDFAKYNGTSLTNDNCANPSDLYASILTINSARMKHSLPLYDAASFINNLSDTTGVVLGATLFKYNYIVANAITDNLVLFHNGKLYNLKINGIIQNPYDEAFSLLFSPGRQVHRGTSVQYKFSLNNIISNCQIAQVAFDAGDGNGYDYDLLNGPSNFVVNYSTVGPKELKLRITLTNNDVLIGHSLMDILPNTTYSPSYIPDPDRREEISLASDESIKAVVSYKYAQGHNEKLIRPLIYVEGFDHGLMALGALFDGDDFWAGLANAYSLFETAFFEKGFGVFDYFWLQRMVLDAPEIKDNYDIIYVDWGAPTADIRDNALLLESIILHINNQKVQHGQPYSKNTIIGHSMGGLITRYALCEIEQDNTKLHDTQYYISFDSPHLGANVPLGALYAFEDLGRVFYNVLLNENIPNINSVFLGNFYLYLYSILRSPSALQMMYYSVFNSEPYTGYHTYWQSILNDIGFPEGDPGCPIENLAIVNGGSIASTDPLMRIYANIGNSFSWSQILLYVSSGLTNMNLDFQVRNNRGDGGVVSTSSAKYTKKFLWRENKNIDILNGIKQHYSVPGTIGYDVKPSSILTLTNIEPGESVDTVSFNSEDLPFVPVASAFAMADNNSSYSRNFTVSPPTPLIETPFESYYFPNDGYYQHDLLDALRFSWVYKQTNMSITGIGDFVQTGDSLSVQTVGADYYNSSWSTSDSSVATINCDTVIVHNPGPVRITYNCLDSSDVNAKYYKHKTVFAGFPAIALTKTHISDNYYLISAQCVDSSIVSSFSEFVSNGVFSYVWGKKVGFGSINWYSPTNTSSLICDVPDGVDVTVFLKIRANTGGESEVLSFVVQKINHEFFFHDPTYIRVTPRIVRYMHQYVSGFTNADGSYFHPNNCLYLWKNDSFPVTLVPDAVRIGNQSLPLSQTILVYDGDTPVTLYQFNISQSNIVQQATGQGPLPPGGLVNPSLSPITIEVICNNVVEQTISLPVFNL